MMRSARGWLLQIALTLGVCTTVGAESTTVDVVSHQIAIWDALQAGAVVGFLLMMAGLSLVWWLLSPRVTLAWQTLALVLLSLNQIMLHSVPDNLAAADSLDMRLRALCAVGSFCPLVLMLYLRSLARAYTLGIRGMPVFFALAGAYAMLCLAVLTSDWHLFVRTSHLGVLALLTALIVGNLFQIGVWQLRYVVGVAGALVMLWGFRLRDLFLSNPLPGAGAADASYASGFLIVAVALLGLAFWVHRQGTWRERNDIEVNDLLSRQDMRLKRAVTRRTRTLNATLMAAQHTNRQQTRLMAYIGHDLRAPMASIVGYAKLLRDGGNSAHKKHIAAIERGAAHQLVLIDELLDHVRGELHLFTLKPVPLNLRDLLEDIRQQALTMAARHHNVYLFEGPNPSPHWVMLDGTRLHQVLLNLISNAAKFTHDGSITLLIAARCEGSSWTVSFEVADTGTGIEVKDQERVFGRFEQSQPIDGGLGLGLFIAHSIVENMGGHLTLSSVPGVGSTFRFEVIMPALEAPQPALETSADVVREQDRADLQRALGMRRPSGASLTHLSLLASRGQWTEIDQWIAQTLTAQPECAAFIAIIAELFDELDFDRIRTLASCVAVPTGKTAFADLVAV
jgi:signal transduction histidine kinase